LVKPRRDPLGRKFGLNAGIRLPKIRSRDLTEVPGAHHHGPGGGLGPPSPIRRDLDAEELLAGGHIRHYRRDLTQAPPNAHYHGPAGRGLWVAPPIRRDLDAEELLARDDIFRGVDRPQGFESMMQFPHNTGAKFIKGHQGAIPNVLRKAITKERRRAIL